MTAGGFRHLTSPLNGSTNDIRSCSPGQTSVTSRFFDLSSYDDVKNKCSIHIAGPRGKCHAAALEGHVHHIRTLHRRDYGNPNLLVWEEE